MAMIFSQHSPVVRMRVLVLMAGLSISCMTLQIEEHHMATHHRHHPAQHRESLLSQHQASSHQASSGHMSSRVESGRRSFEDSHQRMASHAHPRMPRRRRSRRAQSRNGRRNHRDPPLPKNAASVGRRQPENAAALLMVNQRTFPEILEDGDTFAKNYVRDDNDFVLKQQVKRDRGESSQEGPKDVHKMIALHAAELAEERQQEQASRKHRMEKEAAERALVRKRKKLRAQALWAKKSILQQQKRYDSLVQESEKARQEMLRTKSSSAGIQEKLRLIGNRTEALEKEEALLQREYWSEKAALRTVLEAGRRAQKMYKVRTQDLAEVKASIEEMEKQFPNVAAEEGIAAGAEAPPSHLVGAGQGQQDSLGAPQPAKATAALDGAAVVAVDKKRDVDPAAATTMMWLKDGAKKAYERVVGTEAPKGTEDPTAPEEASAPNKTGAAPMLGDALKEELEAEEAAKNEGERKSKTTGFLHSLLFLLALIPGMCKLPVELL